MDVPDSSTLPDTYTVPVLCGQCHQSWSQCSCGWGAVTTDPSPAQKMPEEVLAIMVERGISFDEFIEELQKAVRGYSYSGAN